MATWTISPNTPEEGVTSTAMTQDGKFKVEFDKNDTEQDRNFTITYIDDYNNSWTTGYTVPVCICNCTCDDLNIVGSTTISLEHEQGKTASTRYTISNYNAICGDAIQIKSSLPDWLNAEVTTPRLIDGNNYTGEIKITATSENNTGQIRNFDITLSVKGTDCTNKKISVSQNPIEPRTVEVNCILTFDIGRSAQAEAQTIINYKGGIKTRKITANHTGGGQGSGILRIDDTSDSIEQIINDLSFDLGKNSTWLTPIYGTTNLKMTLQQECDKFVHVMQGDECDILNISSELLNCDGCPQTGECENIKMICIDYDKRIIKDANNENAIKAFFTFGMSRD